MNSGFDLACGDGVPRGEESLRWDTLFANPRALGVLRDWAAVVERCFGHDGANSPATLLCVFCGDHRAALDGISLFRYGESARLAVAASRGDAAVSSFCRVLGCELRLIDVGLAAERSLCPNVVDCRVVSGVANISREAAMSEAECRLAMQVGADQASIAVAAGFSILAVGEIGIGNTASATAMAARLLDVDPVPLVGRGTGIDSDAYQRKVAVVMQAVARIARDPDSSPLKILRELGGAELAAIVGFILRATELSKIVVLDGCATAVAALIAVRLDRLARGVMLPSHLSSEPAHAPILAELGLRPVITAGMGMGEGTGAVVGAALVRVVLDVVRRKKRI